jgi:transmembrane sensor
MNEINDKIWVLMTRQLSGEATQSEKKELQGWLDENPKHREFYNSIADSWNRDPGPSADTPFFFDYESGLKKLQDKLNQETFKSKRKKIPHRRRSGRYNWAIAASVLAAVFSLTLFVTMHVLEAPQSVTYETSGVEQRIITLSDGSVVRLNRDSKMEVTQSYYDGGDRLVRLEGEAFFDVAERPDRPFIIQADDAIVQVLGTSFNVRGGEEVMVAVQEGLVSFRHKDHQENSSARLGAGQLGLLTADNREIIIEETNVENYLSWKNGYLRFDDMPFGEVVKQLERIYGIQHELQDEAISSYRLTVFTERTEQNEVLESIAAALGLAYTIQEDTIRWGLGDSHGQR